MKFGKIISATGMDPNNYPNIAETEVVVYDYKRREIMEKDFNFSTPIFSENPISLKDFECFLKKWNHNDECIHVHLTEDFLVVIGPRPSIFRRRLT